MRSHPDLLAVIEEAELRQKEREIDRLYGKLVAGSPLTDAKLCQQFQEALTRLAMADGHQSA